jgi:hypothetical protein
MVSVREKAQIPDEKEARSYGASGLKDSARKPYNKRFKRKQDMTGIGTWFACCKLIATLEVLSDYSCTA